MALSADQGSSRVMCKRRLVFLNRTSEWSEMPVDAASLMIATFLVPAMKNFFSCTFTLSRSSTSYECRSWYMNSLLSGLMRTTLPLRPVISATLFGPPRRSTRASNAEAGSSIALTSSRSCCWRFTSSVHSTSPSSSGKSEKSRESDVSSSARGSVVLVVGMWLRMKWRRISRALDTRWGMHMHSSAFPTARSMLASPVVCMPITTA
mmetsp:Transcript_21/g.70  ORF Transcript_21/g.70 Transcript_21/m.70 type:complete len:207 (-) Transcript_21:252-872(-)